MADTLRGNALVGQRLEVAFPDHYGAEGWFPAKVVSYRSAEHNEEGRATVCVEWEDGAREDLVLTRRGRGGRIKQKHRLLGPVESAGAAARERSRSPHGTVGGRCAICLEDCVPRGGRALFSCGKCGNFLHLDCVNNMPEQFCPLCREAFARPAAQRASRRLLMIRIQMRGTQESGDH
jgi:hypothetical protein